MYKNLSTSNLIHLNQSTQSSYEKVDLMRSTISAISEYPSHDQYSIQLVPNAEKEKENSHLRHAKRNLEHNRQQNHVCVFNTASNYSKEENVHNNSHYCNNALINNKSQYAVASADDTKSPIKNRFYIDKRDNTTNSYCLQSQQISTKNHKNDTTTTYNPKDNFLLSVVNDGYSTKDMKKCKSLKTFKEYNKSEEGRSRKSKRVQAYEQLLKSSENLLEKYKMIEDEESRLKQDLKNSQIRHSKSNYLTNSYVKNKPLSHYQKPTYVNDVDVGGNVDDFESFKRQINKYDNNKYQIKVTNMEQDRTPKSSIQERKGGIKRPFKSKILAKALSSNNLMVSDVRASEVQSKHQKIKPSVKFIASYNEGFTNLKKVDCQHSRFRVSMDVQAIRPLFLSNKTQKISLKDFSIGKVLGSGAFGQVFPALHKRTNMLFALKKVKKQTVRHMLDQFIQEIKIQLFLDHPNIVKLYSFFDDSDHFYILLEYMQGGSLYSYLKKNKNLTVQQAAQRLKQTCQGLKHMHDNQILHRDIKPQNIVMTHNVCKLCDFGWSAICKDRRTTYCGTLDYVCPEIIDGQGYDDSIDIWCIGVLAYELIAGKTPFYNISRKQTIKKIIGIDLQYPENMPQIATNFIKKILRKNPDERTGIDQVLKDPLLKLALNQSEKTECEF